MSVRQISPGLVSPVSFQSKWRRGQETVQQFVLYSEVCVCVCVVGVKPWSYMMEVLEEKNGSDTELLMFAMTLINKVK